MAEEPIVIFGPNNMGLATMNNSVKNVAKGFISGAVNSNYFNDLWKTRNKASNYTVMSMDPATNGAVVGFAIVSRKDPDFHKIELIGTKPGGGIGKRLVEQIKQNSLRAGALAVELNSVTTAKGFYEKLGFIRLKNKYMNNGTINTHQMLARLNRPSFTIGKMNSPKKTTTQRTRTRRTPAATRTRTRTRTTVGVRRKRSPSPVAASPATRSQSRRVRQKK
jgi:ribosomal protein S18 acetylase RimI-like enzyme